MSSWHHLGVESSCEPINAQNEGTEISKILTGLTDVSKKFKNFPFKLEFRHYLLFKSKKFSFFLFGQVVTNSTQPFYIFRENWVT